MDCGSGLVLLLREAMTAVPPGGVLEMRSREPTVADDLPPWCRLAGHTFLGRVGALGEAEARYLIRRGASDAALDRATLEADKAKARAYEWRVRARATGPRSSRAYCRNFAIDVGQPASFDASDVHPSAVEVLLAALAGDLAATFKVEASRAGVVLDDVELVVRGRLTDVLAHLGVGDGDPALSEVDVRCFAQTGADEAAVRAAWELACARSPVARTLHRACRLALAVVVA